MDLINKDLIFVITFGLYTKFIEAEREHTCGKTQVFSPFSGPQMRNISHFSWVKFTYLFLAQPLSYWHSFRTLRGEALLILKAGKYGKKFFSLL
jgi:hypothetical protein